MNRGRILQRFPVGQHLAVNEAAGFLGQILIEWGHYQAGREHLLFQYVLGGEEDAREAVQMLVKTGSSSQAPLLLKQEMIMQSDASRHCLWCGRGVGLHKRP